MPRPTSRLISSIWDLRMLATPSPRAEALLRESRVAASRTLTLVTKVSPALTKEPTTRASMPVPAADLEARLLVEGRGRGVPAGLLEEVLQPLPRRHPEVLRLLEAGDEQVGDGLTESVEAGVAGLVLEAHDGDGALRALAFRDELPDEKRGQGDERRGRRDPNLLRRQADRDLFRCLGLAERQGAGRFRQGLFDPGELRDELVRALKAPGLVLLQGISGRSSRARRGSGR